MERADQSLLTLAQMRNRSIPTLIESGGVYSRPTAKKTERMRGIADFYIGSIQIEGGDNLAEAFKLSEKGKLVITSNHQTDLDHAAKRHIFEELGFGRFADRLVYPAGLKMLERWYIKPFMGGEHTVFIATPKDLEDALGLWTRNKKEPFLTESQRSILVEYRKNLTNLNDEASDKFESLTSQGYVVALYPEAGRSYHPRSLLQRAAPSTALYTLPQTGEYKIDQKAYVLPMSVGGLNRVLPPNKFMRFWRRADVRVVFEEPYPVSEIWDPRRAKALKEMGAEKADYMMAKIAILNPNLVEPKDMEFYKRVLVA